MLTVLFIVPKGGLQDGNNKIKNLVNNGFWMNWNKRKMLLNLAASFIVNFIIYFMHLKFKLPSIFCCCCYCSSNTGKFLLLPRIEKLFVIYYVRFGVSIAPFSVSFKKQFGRIENRSTWRIPSSNFHQKIKI